MEKLLQSMYIDFRKELDSLEWKDLLKECESGVKQINHGDKIVGFLMVNHGYVVGLYIQPEFRRKGLGRKAVVDYIREGGHIETLTIVNNNSTAKSFWSSLFILEVVNKSISETYYKVSLKKKFHKHITGECYECN